MISWKSRPIEVKTLLNPAFCGELIKECVITYNQRKGPFPFPLAFMILPIILHGSTRKTIPYIPRHMHIWTQNNREILIGFPKRTRNLIPITLEAIHLLLMTEIIILDKSGNFVYNNNLKLKKIKHNDSEVQDCINKCRNLGKLFATGGNISTIFAIWGIRP